MLVVRPEKEREYITKFGHENVKREKAWSKIMS